jgi:tRNA/rRNA methyltransferase
MGLLDRVCVVLVRPEGDINVGSVCRAMKTMGLRALRLVGTPRSAFDEQRVRAWAVHAFEIFDGARFCGTLPEALADTALAAGVSRRRGMWRKQVSLLPEELPPRVAAAGRGSVAAVFGNERTGLTDAEIQLCSLAVHIPASPVFPSLNLSHAVQIIGYALRRAEVPQERYAPVDRARVEELAALFTSALYDLGYFRHRTGRNTQVLMRDVLARACLHEHEAGRLESIFRTLPHLGERGRCGRRGSSFAGPGPTG